VTDEERTAAGMQTRREVLGDEHVDRAVANTTDFNAPFQDFITRYAWASCGTGQGCSAVIRLGALSGRLFDRRRQKVFRIMGWA
jgi:alkylhydroperoxidase/carboxymuconolactone decarboxylase family protein YurZ